MVGQNRVTRYLFLEFNNLFLRSYQVKLISLSQVKGWVRVHNQIVAAPHSHYGDSGQAPDIELLQTLPDNCRFGDNKPVPDEFVVRKSNQLCQRGLSNIRLKQPIALGANII